MPLADSFALAPDAREVASRLIADCEEFSHLAEARLLVVSSQRQPVLHGAPCVAFVAAPRVQGPLHFLYEWLLADLASTVFAWEDADFVIVLDAAMWAGFEVEDRERVLYHELSHIVAKEDEDSGVEKRGDDGRILLKLVPHTYEFFDLEVRRYGPERCNLGDAAVAIADGHRRAQRRGLRLAG